MPRSEHRRSLARGVIAGIFVVIALLLLAWRASAFRGFLSDDALISLRYSQRLIQGDGLTWTEGPRVEGYSNLLWVLLNALVGWFGVDLIVSARWLGFVGMGAAAVAIAYRSIVSRAIPAMMVSVLVFVLTAPVAAWVAGGMEQPLVAGLLAWAVVLAYPLLEDREVSVRQLLLPGLFLGLLCITRPDSPIFIATLVLTLWAVRGGRGDTVRRTAGLLALPALFLGGQLAFRLLYYGAWVPNTALVKISPSLPHLWSGLKYVIKGTLALSPFLPLSVVGGFVLLGRGVFRARTILHLITLTAWLGYLVFIGGDIFPAWRHFIPAIVLMALLIADEVEWLQSVTSLRSLRRFAPAGMVLLAVLMGAYLWNQARNSENRRANQEQWIFDGLYLGDMLREGFGAAQPILAVEPAGAVPYASQLPALDLLGLNDYHIPRQPVQDRGQGWIGHELGDGKYVMDARPDLILFCLPSGNYTGCYRSGKEMMADPAFFERYTFAQFEVTTPYAFRSKLWVSRESPRIGVQRTAEQVFVPAYLFSADPDPVSRLDDGMQFVVYVPSGQEIRFDRLTLGAGTWQMAAPDSRGLTATVYPAGGQQAIVAEAPLPASIAVGPQASASYDVVLAYSGADTVRLAGLTLHRIP